MTEHCSCGRTPTGHIGSPVCMLGGPLLGQVLLPSPHILLSDSCDGDKDQLFNVSLGFCEFGGNFYNRKTSEIK